MSWNKLLLLLLIPFLAMCSTKEPNFFVFNKDEQTIDSLYLHVQDETYLIENLKPNQTKSIHLDKMRGDTRIILETDQETFMSLNSGFLHPQTKGTLKIMITKDRIVSTSTHSN